MDFDWKAMGRRSIEWWTFDKLELMVGGLIETTRLIDVLNTLRALRFLASLGLAGKG